MAGKIELEMVPQGSFTERIRAGGAGIPAFYTPVGFGTELAEGKEIRRFSDRDYVLEAGDRRRPRAGARRHRRPDGQSDLQLRPDELRARDGHSCETCGGGGAHDRSTSLLPHEAIQLPGTYVDRVVVRHERAQSPANHLARRARTSRTAMLVNLGIGLPVHCSDYLKPDVDVILQSENGVVGVGPLAEKDKADTDLVDAGRPPHHAAARAHRSSMQFVVVRDDPRRACGRDDSRRVRGGVERRPRQLGHARSQSRPAGRRCDGSGGLCARGVGHRWST